VDGNGTWHVLALQHGGRAGNLLAMAGYAHNRTARPDLRLEQGARARHRGLIAGVDEAGRGPWAGPVVAAAVILDPAAIPEGLDDSKRLSAQIRAALFDALMASAQVGLGIVPVDEIDNTNILRASLKAMAQAVADLPAAPAGLLVDGCHAPPVSCPVQAVPGGDGSSLSIAAASIIAKVSRDRIMLQLGADFPHYGWERNKGYGTREHADAIARHGISPHHRRSFAPIRRAIAHCGRA
jgi:ribonuclease HII